MEKKWVNKHYKQFDSYIKLDATIIKQLQEAIEAEKRGEWKDLAIETYNEYDFCYIAICGKRLETDDELERRMTDEQRQEEYQREMYERLKQRFEK